MGAVCPEPVVGGRGGGRGIAPNLRGAPPLDPTKGGGKDFLKDAED